MISFLRLIGRFSSYRLGIFFHSNPFWILWRAHCLKLLMKPFNVVCSFGKYSESWYEVWKTTSKTPSWSKIIFFSNKELHVLKHLRKSFISIQLRMFFVTSVLYLMFIVDFGIGWYILICKLLQLYFHLLLHYKNALYSFWALEMIFLLAFSSNYMARGIIFCFLLLIYKLNAIISCYVVSSWHFIILPIFIFTF